MLLFQLLMFLQPLPFPMLLPLQLLLLLLQPTFHRPELDGSVPKASAYHASIVAKRAGGDADAT